MGVIRGSGPFYILQVPGSTSQIMYQIIVPGEKGLLNKFRITLPSCQQ
jgi:hypothetical protein